jgi:hypothetical protein
LIIKIQHLLSLLRLRCGIKVAKLLRRMKLKQAKATTPIEAQLIFDIYINTYFITIRMFDFSQLQALREMVVGEE